MSVDNEKRISVKYILDNTGFNNKLQGINQQLKMNQSQFKATSSHLKNFGSTQDLLKSKVDSLNKQFTLQKQKVELYNKSIEKSSKALENNVKERSKLKSELDACTNRHKQAIAIYGKEHEKTKAIDVELKKLEQDYKAQCKTVESNAKEINNYSIKLDNAKNQMNRTQGELNKLNKELIEGSSKWNKASEKLHGFGDKAQKVGGVMGGVGNKILMASAPLVALGGYAMKVGADFEQGMSEVGAISGATGNDLRALTDKAKEMGEKTKFSCYESTQAFKYMSMAGWKTSEMLDGIEGIMNLAASSGENLASVSDICTDAMSGFGLQAKDSTRFADVLASASSNANVSVGTLGESFKYVAPVCGTFGFSAEDTAVALALMGNQGIKASQSGTALRGVLANLAKPSDSVYSGMKRIGLSFTDASGKVKPLKQLMDELREKMGKLSKAEKGEIGTLIAGKEAMSGLLAIVNASPQEYDKLTNAINNCDGTAKKMADTMNDNLKGQLTLLKSQFEGVCIQISKELIPIAKDVLSHVSKWLTAWSKLDDGTKHLIIKIAEFTLATGGFLKLTGGVVSGIGGMAKTFGNLSKAIGGVSSASKIASGVMGAEGLASSVGLLGGSVGSVLLTLAPWALGIGAVALASYGLYTALQDEVIPQVDLFADKVEQSSYKFDQASQRMVINEEQSTIKISQATKDKVGAYMKLDRDVLSALNHLYIGAKDITDQDCKEQQIKYTEMGNSIKIQLHQDSEERLKIMQDFYANSDALTDEEEKESIVKLQEYNANKEKDIDDNVNQIMTIYNRAKEEHRNISTEEYEIITGLQNDMKENAVNTLSETEVESKLILERMKGNDNRITAEEMSNNIKLVNDAKNKEIKSANDKCDAIIRNAIIQRDETGTLTSEQADKVIEEAKRQRDESVTHATETRDQAVEKIRGMNTDVAKEVDETTGKIKTAWDGVVSWWNSWSFKSKSMNVESNSSLLPKDIMNHASGTKNYPGGLTTLHEKGYEVYDLPQGTRIYNHDSSVDMIEKTVDKVVSQLIGNKSLGGQDATIVVPINLDGKEIARITTPYISENLATNNARSKNWGRY